MSEQRWNDVERYLREATVGADPVFDAALAASAKAGLPPIEVTATGGKFLMLLATLASARRVLEIGTLGGFSTMWLARALPSDGRLITLELEEAHAAVARANIERAGFRERVEVRVGPALKSLEALRTEGAGPFDFTFIDADKVNTPAYFEYAVGLSRPGAAIVVDNVVRDGRILDGTGRDPSVRGMRTFFDALANDRRVSATAIQTVGPKGYDGFALALVL